jgi:hypothetical protein
MPETVSLMIISGPRPMALLSPKVLTCFSVFRSVLARQHSSPLQLILLVFHKLHFNLLCK